jgi:hypothetical protein
MNHDETEVSQLVDSLLAEFGIVEVPADAELPKAAAPKADRAEMPRRSWMDQVGRAKKVG